MKLQCSNDDCNHEWEYGGDKSPGAYTNCPRCMYKVKIVDDD